MRRLRTVEEMIWIPFSFKPVFNATGVLRDLFYFVGVTVASCGEFLLTTTLPFALRRDESSFLFQLKDTADICKTHTNQYNNL